MNRQQRRRVGARGAGKLQRPRSREELAEHCGRILEEGQGVFSLELFPPERFFEVMDRSVEGDKVAIAALNAIPLSEGNDCLLCDRTFDMDLIPHTMVLLRAAVDKPSAITGSACCPHCVEQHAENLFQAVFARYREVLIHDARLVTVSDQSGTA